MFGRTYRNSSGGRFNGASKIGDITDGTSNTIAMSERLRGDTGVTPENQILVRTGVVSAIANLRKNPGACMATVGTGGYYLASVQAKARTGLLWDGQMERLGFTTITPPNGPGCAETSDTNADHNHTVIPPSRQSHGRRECPDVGRKRPLY